ncbi:DNA topoisomerase 1 alpha-like isoform X1 [Telopea speciosissima]|uniref:DNA topoisomerase 1 alpha-like isoform X1 n=1 Tax=Telopea speciosissima TaxID=54955 RepID=UPI001CC64BF5|nr:DNA topoisomerase 1 alpha-like isoform X1 [Telopea speciosissima]XP_043688382.1 DNA topoisomerase 1 alpha-like isoform X1 [Telopea speciosissima]
MAAVDSCIKPKIFDDGEDDDGPAVFKRNKTSSTRTQLNPELKKSSSQRHDGSSMRSVSDTPNSQNSGLQKGKAVSSAKVSPVKSNVASLNASTSIANKSSSSLQQNTEINKEKKLLNKHQSQPNGDPDDSDDDKPLSVRLATTSATLPKSQSPNVLKGVSSLVCKSSQLVKAKVSIKKSDEDLEDDIPLSSKFQLKPSGGTSSKYSYDSDEDNKPLSSKLQQNGSSKRDNEPLKCFKGLNKRPLSEASSSGQSSIKKLKTSASPVPAKIGQVTVKAEARTDDDDDNVPIAQRMKKAAPLNNKSISIKKSTKVVSASMKKMTKKSKKFAKNSKYSKSTKVPPSSGEGQKWTTLVHNGVIFPPPYKPHGVKMLYNGQPVDLTPGQEEVATMFAVMKDTDYATKPRFIENFMNDWRQVLGKNHIIKKFELCDFTPIYEWHQREKEKKKQMSTEEKKALKEEKLKLEEKYMWAIVDGVKEKVGNFRVEPPGLFRGRGEHPKMGKLKRRIYPSDITINIGEAAPVPECPIPGERWKEVKHDNTVTWLAFWNDPINPREFKYVFLAASSSLKGQSDKEKYEKARLLKDYIREIRATYTKDFVSKDITKRQIAVATYLIDKLALRAGNEKDDDEADTVGCCTLKAENVTLVPPNKLQFDFLGKDSIRYFNTVEVELPVYKAIGKFKDGKKDGEDLFDKLDTSKLNAHLKELMPGLTAKVFRTYNASITLDEMLNIETKDGDVAEKIVVYQHANKEVAIICNHQRSVSKSHSVQMSRLSEKMDELKAVLDELQKDLMRAKKGKPLLNGADGKPKRNSTPEALERKIVQTNAKIEKMERDMKTKEDLKTVALGTSKINYLDPRISVAWCKRHEVPIEKIFNKSLLAKFSWAMDVDPSFRF